MKKTLIILLALIGLSASAVEARYPIDDTYWIEKQYDNITENHTYVIYKKGEAFSGLFYGGSSKEIKTFLKDKKYEPISSWKLGGSAGWVVFCKVGDKKSIIHIKKGGVITHIVTVDTKVKVVTKTTKVVEYRDATPLDAEFDQSFDDYFKTAIQ